MQLPAITDALDFREMFGGEAPLDVDLGCGDGTFIAGMACRFPAHNFLGIERLKGRFESTQKKITSERLMNARVLRAETRHFVEQLLPKESISAFHLLFPDPWPKRRHQSRRIVTPTLIELLFTALVPAGLLHFATDQQDYFKACARIIESGKCFASCDGEIEFPVTTFERHFRDRTVPIYRLLMRKISPVTNACASQPASPICSAMLPVSS